MFNLGLLCPDSIPKFLGLFDLSVAPSLLFYSYIPIIIASLFFGIYVFLKDNKSPRSKLLFYLSLTFALLLLNEIITWIGSPVAVVLFGWQLVPLFRLLVPIFTVLFVCVFIGKDKISTSIKFLMGISVLIVIVLIPTSLNIKYFDLPNCEGIPGPLWSVVHLFEILSVLWLLFFGVRSFIKNKKGTQERRIIVYLTTGAVLFLLIFFVASIWGDITKIYEVALVGPVGMFIFIAFMTFMIVRFGAFNIKLLGAEALVLALIFLIGSQLFFVQNPTNRILTAITLVLVAFFGWLLVKGVKMEIKQREEIDRYAKELVRAKERVEAAYGVEKKAKEELQHIDEAKSQFVMATQHHLRTPLTALKGYLSMALEGDFGKVNNTLKEKLGFCFVSTNRLIKLINEFLDISKLQLGRDILEIKEASISEILRDVIVEVKPEADKKNVYLALTLPEGNIPLAMVDSTKLREAMYNLIDNAVKYTEKGGVKVELSVSNKDGKNFLLITVTDTGIGMSEDEVKNVFGRQFERGREAKKVYALGRGIGLYLAASIIRAHKAVIMAESGGQGKGSSFYIELPIKQ